MTPHKAPFTKCAARASAVRLDPPSAARDTRLRARTAVYRITARPPLTHFSRPSSALVMAPIATVTPSLSPRLRADRAVRQ